MDKFLKREIHKKESQEEIRKYNNMPAYRNKEAFSQLQQKCKEMNCVLYNQDKKQELTYEDYIKLNPCRKTKLCLKCNECNQTGTPNIENLKKLQNIRCECLNAKRANALRQPKRKRESQIPEDWKPKPIDELKNEHELIGKKFHHPIFTDWYYEYDTNEIYKIGKSNPILGSKNGRYRIFSIYSKHKLHKKQWHRFVYECVYNIEIPHEHQIDHINPNIAEGELFNHISNLQRLTCYDHRRKTHMDNPSIGKKMAKTIGLNGKATKGDKTEYFESITQLGIIIDREHTTILEFLDNPKRNQINGWTILLKQEQLEGEEWKKHPTLPYWLSNKGRIKREGTQRITYGSKGGNDWTYKYNGHTVSHLILEAFIGLRPDKDDTADHINRNPLDNELSNLRWATKKEQARNSSNVYALSQIDRYTCEEIKSFPCITDATEETGHCYKSIVNAEITSRRSYFFIPKSTFMSYKLNQLRIQYLRATLRDFTGCFHKDRMFFTPTGFFENKNTNTRTYTTYMKLLYPTPEEFKLVNQASNKIKVFLKSYINYNKIFKKRQAPNITIEKYPKIAPWFFFGDYGWHRFRDTSFYFHQKYAYYRNAARRPLEKHDGGSNQSIRLCGRSMKFDVAHSEVFAKFE